MAPVDGENLKVLPQFGFRAELSEKPNCIGIEAHGIGRKKIKIKEFLD
jgi:hypothetical protein